MLHQKSHGKVLPRIVPRMHDITLCSANCRSKFAPWLAPEPPPSSMSALTTSMVIANKRTTTTSIITVTVSTVVVKGPLALISSMIAMAEDGDRATERQAMSSAALNFCAWPTSRRKGRKVGPQRSVVEMEPMYVTTTNEPKILTALVKFSRTSLRLSLPPAERPMKPRATSLNHSNFFESCTVTKLVPYGPRTMPKKRKIVMAGKPNPESRLPKVFAAIPAMKSMSRAAPTSEKHIAVHPVIQQ
mmetsp:Transcript_4291/g.14122  ORF Transcript_4291/g.14122 Transcript_4291/m.14122 type:complete len:245 (+) Transcript_4291:2571-3305(+)